MRSRGERWRKAMNLSATSSYWSVTVVRSERPGPDRGVAPQCEEGLWGAAPTFVAHKAMAKPSHAPPSRRRAGRERLCGILRSSALRDIFMIWALLAGAPAPPRVTRATSPHPAPIVSGGRLCAPVRQREIPTLGLPCVARDGVWMP